MSRSFRFSVDTDHHCAYCGYIVNCWINRHFVCCNLLRDLFRFTYEQSFLFWSCHESRIRITYFQKHWIFTGFWSALAINLILWIKREIVVYIWINKGIECPFRFKHHQPLLLFIMNGCNGYGHTSTTPGTTDSTTPGGIPAVVKHHPSTLGMQKHRDIWCLPTTPEFLLDCVSEFEMKSNDILIVGYPKSGK